MRDNSISLFQALREHALQVISGTYRVNKIFTPEDIEKNAEYEITIVYLDGDRQLIDIFKIRGAQISVYDKKSNRLAMKYLIFDIKDQVENKDESVIHPVKLILQPFQADNRSTSDSDYDSGCWSWTFGNFTAVFSRGLN